ncbi:MAG: type II secretion system F family protein [Caloramator sp.]|nr:type II secretion system F family protein [Caloramator sp.]
MPAYRFRAKNINGDIISGSVISEDENGVITIIREYGYYPYFIKNCNKSLMDLFIPSKLTSKELFMICKQISLFISSGVNIIQAFQIIKDGMNLKVYKDYFEGVIQSIEKGMNISNALCRNQRVPDILVKMVKVGENSGRLDEIMESMAEYFEWKYKSEEKLKQILIYPIIVAVFALVVINILLFKVIPSFLSIFNQFDIKEFPLSTKVVLSISSFIRGKWFIIILFLCLFFIIIKKFFKDKDLFAFLNSIRLNIPIYNKIYINVLWLNFIRAFSMLVLSGVSIIESMDICLEVIDDKNIKSSIQGAIEMIKEGSSIGCAFEAQKIVPQNIIKSIKIGEESGSLDLMLKKCYEIYEIEVENQSARILTIIEPAIIVVLSFIVGFIVISVIAPIFQIYDIFGYK